MAIDIEDVGHGKGKKDKGSGGMSAKSLDSNHDGRVIASKNVRGPLLFDSLFSCLSSLANRFACLIVVMTCHFRACVML